MRLQLHALAYNLANFLRSLVLPREVEQWSLTTLREKLVKIGARIVRHGHYAVFQLAEVGVSRALFAEILRRIAATPGMSVAGNDRSHPDRRGASMSDREPPNVAARWGASLMTRVDPVYEAGSRPWGLPRAAGRRIIPLGNWSSGEFRLLWYGVTPLGWTV